MTESRQYSMSQETIANISHDIRAPLAGVLMAFRRYLNSNGAYSPAETRQLILASERSLARVIGVIEYLTAQEQLSAGELHAIRSDTVVKPLIDDLIQELSPISSIKNVQLINHVPLSSRMYIDPLLFARMLTNLLMNALKFCRDGDSVHVSIEQDVLSVRDTGVGINEHSSGKNNLSHSTSTAGEAGTGMGLDICRRIASAHAGEVNVTSVPEGGTEVRVRIGNVDHRALIIGCNPALANQIKSYLAARHHRFAILSIPDFANAELALKHLYVTPPNIVFINATTAWSRAISLIHRLREIGSSVATKILTFSEPDFEEDGRWANREMIAAGADDFAVIPIADAAMAKLIDGHLGASSSPPST